MADAKKMIAIGAGLAILGAFWKKAQANVLVDTPTSVHEFDIITSSIDAEAKKFLIAAVRRNLGDRIPIAGYLSNVKVTHWTIRGNPITTVKFTWNYDPDLSVKLLGMVESSLDPHYFHIRKLDNEHYQALLGYDDIGIFQINRHYHHDIDWDWFTAEDYVHQAEIVIDRNRGEKPLKDVMKEFLPSDDSPEASERFALALYDRLWNRNAAWGSQNARNFLRKYRAIIGEINQIKTIEYPY